MRSKNKLYEKFKPQSPQKYSQIAGTSKNDFLNKIRPIIRSYVKHPNFMSFTLLFSSTFTLVLSVVLLIDGFLCYGGLPKTDQNGKYQYDSENKLILHDYNNIWFWDRKCSNRCTGKDETDYCEPALNFESLLGAVFIVFGVVLSALWRDSMDVNMLTRKRENEIDLSTTDFFKISFTFFI